MIKLLRAFAMALFCTASLAVQGAIAVRVNAVINQCEVRIDSSVTNYFDESVSVIEGHLPWTHGIFGMALIVQQAGGSRETLKGMMVLDHPDALVKLPPGATLRGTLSLNERFPDLAAALRKSDLGLYWTHVMHPLTEQELVNDEREDDLPPSLHVGAIWLKKCDS